ncbi:hypothetical protein ABRP58_17645 [Pectobacterium aroidearum]
MLLPLIAALRINAAPLKNVYPRPDNLTHTQQFYTITMLLFHQPLLMLCYSSCLCVPFPPLWRDFFALHLAFYVRSPAGCHFFLQPKTTQIKTKDVDMKTTIVLNRHIAAEQSLQRQQPSFHVSNNTHA